MKCFKFFILHSSFIILHGLLFLSLSLKSQNLVPNWSFEDTVHCPGIVSYITDAQHWYSPTLSTPDYYNACSFYYNVPGGMFDCFQYAKEGKAYAGIFVWGDVPVDGRDYIQVELTDSLIKNKWYCGGFWISLHELSGWAVRDIGIYISKNPIGSNGYINLSFIPQVWNTTNSFLTDTVNWVLISGSFQAQGGEKYITIGNFKDNLHTDTLHIDPDNIKPKRTYYFIDNVFLYDCSESVQAYAGEDASICGDETAQLGTTPIAGCHYKWTPNTGLDNDTLANPTAKPLQTTTYVLSMTDPYYQVTTDTVVVAVNNDCKQVFFIPNIFSPNGDGQNDIFRVRGQNIESLRLMVYNRWGNQVFEGNEPNSVWDGTFNGQQCDAGVYYYVAEITFKDGRMESRKGDITLLR